MSATVEGMTMVDIFTRSHLQGEMDQYRNAQQLTVSHQFFVWGVHVATATQVIKSLTREPNEPAVLIHLYLSTDSPKQQQLELVVAVHTSQRNPRIKQPKIPKTPKINQVEAHQEWWHSWTKEEWWIIQLEQGV